MRKKNGAAVCCILALCLLAVTMPKPALAKKGDDEKPFRLRATVGGAPIGRVVSLGGVSVNGKSFTGAQTLWGGEVLQVLERNGASVELDALGEVQLKRGALVRLSTNLADPEDEATRGVIVASLVSGEMSVKLNQEARAYVQSCGEVFAAANGSTFRVSAREGRAVAYATSGTVESQDPAGQKRYFVRPVGMGANISVRARSTRQIQVQVTDENDRPVPDIPIIIALGSAGAGTLGGGAVGAAALTTVTVRTNAQGIATTTYTAGPDAVTTDLTATVEGTRYSWTAQLSVTAAAGFWTPLNTTLVVAGIAAGVATGVYLGTRNNDDPISPNGPPDIRPRN